MSMSLDGGDEGSAAAGALFSNPTDVLHPALKVLKLLLKNIMAHPQETRYRLVKLNNKVLNIKLWPAQGAKEYLIHVLGFVEMSQDGEDVLMCNESSPQQAFQQTMSLIDGHLAPTSPT